MNTDGTTAVADRACKDRARCGFSLIEVCLAILVVGVGLLSIVSLFPTGLRSAEDAVADTRCGLFTDNVMEGLRANALAITSWSDWTNSADFEPTITQGVLEKAGSPKDVSVGGITAWEFPDSSGEWLRYRLTIDSADPYRRSAKLEVCDGRYGSFDARTVAYTEFCYSGL